MCTYLWSDWLKRVVLNLFVIILVLTVQKLLMWVWTWSVCPRQPGFPPQHANRRRRYFLKVRVHLKIVITPNDNKSWKGGSKRPEAFWQHLLCSYLNVRGVKCRTRPVRATDGPGENNGLRQITGNICEGSNSGRTWSCMKTSAHCSGRGELR